MLRIFNSIYFIHRLHCATVTLRKKYPTVSPICDKCQIYEGTLLQSLWACPKIQTFWFSVWILLTPDPHRSVLGVTQNRANKFQSQVVCFNMVSVKTMILQKWKGPSLIEQCITFGRG